MSDLPRLYGELASWWPLISAPADYTEEATVYEDLLRSHSSMPPRSLLELGSGGGNNASHLKRGFDEVTLVDLSPGMLDVSRALNPDCEHRFGDMRTIRLGRTFDCVFVHDAVSYATTAEDLRQVAETAWIHCRPGGTALFVPDFVRENFRPGTSHGGHDGDGRSVRYIEWVWDPDPDDTTYLVDYAYLLREGDGAARVVHDRHVEGLFSTREWIGALEESGFVVQERLHQLSDVEWQSVVFLGSRPSAG